MSIFKGILKNDTKLNQNLNRKNMYNVSPNFEQKFFLKNKPKHQCFIKIKGTNESNCKMLSINFCYFMK